jgi:hypothetical protein
MLEGLRSASARRADCERRLAEAAAQRLGDQTKAVRVVERMKATADSDEFAIPRKCRLLRAIGLSPTHAVPAIPAALLDAAAVERVARSADVRVRDLRTDRANEKFRRARGNRSWDEITWQSLGRWEKQDARRLARRRLDLTESKRSRQVEVRRAFETVVSVLQETGESYPRYTRDSIDGRVRVPLLDLFRAAIELLIGPPVSLTAETSVKWLRTMLRGKPVSPSRPEAYYCSPSAILTNIPDAERRVMRAESAKNLDLLRQLGAGIPTRAILVSDGLEDPTASEGKVKRQARRQK